MTINKNVLQKYLDSFKSYVESQPQGFPFNSFAGNSFIHKEEEYKFKISLEAKTEILSIKWQESEIGNGKYLAMIQKAVHKSQNLIHYHQITHFDNIAQNDPIETERTLFNIYNSGNEEQAFANAIKQFGAKYDLIAFLFFIKDSDRFLPIRSTEFDKRFKLLEFPFSTSYKCSWDNYREFIDIIKHIRDIMSIYYGFPARLIDAHSFVWMLESVDVDNTHDEITFDPTKSVRKETTGMASVRIGQGEFRKSLLQYWESSCSVTGLKMKDYLDASHIKPWCACEKDNEWLNPYNGLLLIPNLHHAFDEGYITFDDNGKIIISNFLNSESRYILGINDNMKLRKISTEHQTFLEYHRLNVFEKFNK